MLKQLIILIFVSISVIFGMSYAQQGIQLLINAHDSISQLLTDVFTVGQAGNIIRGLIALLSVPFLIALLIASAYWLMRRHWFPYFMEIVWIIWLIQAGALIVLYKTAV